MSSNPNRKPIKIQCLNIDCPKCGVPAAFECKHAMYGTMIRPHNERIWAMRKLINDSKEDKLIRKILRERNFSK